jgi:F-box and WD-40 domain protein 1/11
MALLNDLPTSVISRIVENLHPRLYIDFVCYLPPEVCLKVLGYLDPVSLINVARCCRTWYNLALDRKLWEQLYYLEGWKALPDQIAAAERELNRPSSHSQGTSRRMPSHDDGHAYKKRAISLSPSLDTDTDTVMIDAGTSFRQEPTEMESPGNTSIFGGRPRPPLKRATNSDVQAPSFRASVKGKEVGKGKGRAVSPGFAVSSQTADATSWQTFTGPPRVTKSTLWAWDAPSTQFRINWKYLYTMRRRLESNWERGRYINFQFPHPNHPEEGHGECVYSLQFNSQYLVSGSRDRTLKVWDMNTRRCLRTLAKHRGSVLCLQFDSDPDEDLIVSGSSDSDVIIWKFSTGKPIQTLKQAHRESVLNVRFDKRILVTCSKDRTIKVFNRKPLRYGDLGYQEVDPVPRKVDYGYGIPLTPDDYPVIPEWTMIGSLEGHSAAVNAVQIHDREVVSASGDRHIKCWDWPTQVCTRTIVGHNKGIACVQYDGRRIVSGSSDNEVKVYDRETGLEVANLRSHSSLVRTVQAGFGDLPYSVEDDLEEAKKVDQEYFKALESGLLEEPGRSRPGRRLGNAGSRRPEDICAYGAKLPPGGGGGKYGRIVSGSYDASIIIWRRDKEGVWKDQHHFKQETAAVNALQHERAQLQALVHQEAASVLRSRGPAVAASQLEATSEATASTAAYPQTNSTPAGPAAGMGLPSFSTLAINLEVAQADSSTDSLNLGLPGIVDSAVQGGPQALEQAIAAHPRILSLRGYVDTCIDRHPSPVVRSQLRQTFSTAVIRAQFELGRHRREAIRNQEARRATGLEEAAVAQPAAGLTPAQLASATAHQAHAAALHGAPMHQVLAPVPAVVPATSAASASGTGSVTGSGTGSTVSGPGGAHATPAVASQPQAQGQAQAQAQHHHPHIAHAPAVFEAHDPANPARVFKLQYDARRIICCSQRSVIVGWDFCNGDPELEEASRFFAHVD